MEVWREPPEGGAVGEGEVGGRARDSEDAEGQGRSDGGGRVHHPHRHPRQFVARRPHKREVAGPGNAPHRVRAPHRLALLGHHHKLRQIAKPSELLEQFEKFWKQRWERRLIPAVPREQRDQQAGERGDESGGVEVSNGI